MFAGWGAFAKCALSHRRSFSLSYRKLVTYGIALEELGEDTLVKHVGREPSGRNFNELTLDDKGLPHNPFIDSGGAQKED